MVEKLTELEYKVLQMLKEDARRSANSIAKELGVSRATVAKVIKNLKRKGIRFTIEYQEEGELTTFIISNECVGECYQLIDGRILSIVRGKMEEISKVLQSIKEKEYLIAIKRLNIPSVSRAEMYCDYCGGEIRGEPIIVKSGKKLYYACCKTCADALKRKLTRKGEGEGLNPFSR